MLVAEGELQCIAGLPEHGAAYVPCGRTVDAPFLREYRRAVYRVGGIGEHGLPAPIQHRDRQRVGEPGELFVAARSTEGNRVGNRKVGNDVEGFGRIRGMSCSRCTRRYVELRRG